MPSFFLPRQLVVASVMTRWCAGVFVGGWARGEGTARERWLLRLRQDDKPAQTAATLA